MDNREEFTGKYKRDQHGLLIGKDYSFLEDGSIDWRGMVSDDFLYPNKEWFIFRKKDIPKTAEGLKDNQLLINLGGIKELLRIRGFKKVSFDVGTVEKNYVQAVCTIEFIGNYETDGSVVFYEGVGNATGENTSDFCFKFLETIACNRAFVRCVRNFLNIHIVGEDEIDLSEESPSANSPANNTVSFSDATLTPQGMVENLFFNSPKNKNGSKASFEDFKDLAKSIKDLGVDDSEIDSWVEFSKMPPKICRKLLVKLKKLK